LKSDAKPARPAAIGAAFRAVPLTGSLRKYLALRPVCRFGGRLDLLKEPLDGPGPEAIRG
jgi:hypothetical protein